MKLFKITLLVLIHVASSKIDDVRDVRELFDFDDKIPIESRENPEPSGLNTIVTKISRQIFIL